MRETQTNSSAGLIRAGIVVLALVAAGIHFSLLFPDLVFILNGLGFLALLAAYIAPLPIFQKNKNIIRWAFIGYTALTIAAWVILGDKSMPLGWLTKGVEVLLILLLLADQRNEAIE